MFKNLEMEMGTCLSGACHSYMPPQLKTNKQNNMINPTLWDLESQFTTNGQNGTRCSVAWKWALMKFINLLDLLDRIPLDLLNLLDIIVIIELKNKLDNCDKINKNDKDESYTVGPRIKTNGAKNGQNGTRCSVAQKWALAQRTDQ